MEEKLNTYLSELDKCLGNDVMFDNWIHTLDVRFKTDIYEFRKQARSMWESGNIKGIKWLLSTVFNTEIQSKEPEIESKDETPDSYVEFLKKMGIRKGDTLTLHSKEGEMITLKFNNRDLPARKVKKARKSKRSV